MDKKYRSKNYLFSVYNDRYGWDIINELKQNRKIRLRGRHPERKYVMWLHGLTPNYCRDIPVYLSKMIAIYERP